MNKIESIKTTAYNDLDVKSRKNIAQGLNPLIADIFALWVKTKNFHWHISGPHYRDYHLLLDEQSDELLPMIDVLAERVRKLGEKTIQSIGQIKELQHINDVNESLTTKEMLRILLQDNQYFLKSMREVHELCSEGKDVATTSLLENYIDETEKRIWFLSETLAN